MHCVLRQNTWMSQYYSPAKKINVSISTMQEDLTKCRWTICVGLASQPLGKSILLVAPCHRSCDRLLQMCMSFFLYIFCLFSLSSVADSYSRGYSRFTGVWRCLLHLQVTTCHIGGDAHRKNRMVTEDQLLTELKMEL